MGQDVDRRTFSRRDRQHYRAKVQRCLDALATMLRELSFARDEPMTGIEVELNLVGPDLGPSLVGADVLAAIGNPEFQSELGRWNLELNLPPRPLPGDEWRHLEHQLVDALAVARSKAGDCGSQLAVIGILPTLEHHHLAVDALSSDERYRVLNEQMLGLRGEPIRLDIAGDDASGRHEVEPEHLVADFDSIAPEAACTSMQLHLQVHPQSFAGYWNAAQCVAGVQLAVGANSPFLLGSRLWAETRIPLFEQSCDVRTPELRNQGVRPRVWFGERWITSVLDLFAENGRYFPALMPVAQDVDPMEELAAGRVPQLDELRLHNGTIWRWNRPVYDVADGVPHVRVENRVLPAGPTAVDMVANALFFYGLLRALTDADRPLWTSMSFEAAEENFTTAARARPRRPPVLAGQRLDPARRARPAQAAAAGRRGTRAVGRGRCGDRPLPVGDRAALRPAAHRRVVAARHRRGPGGSRGRSPDGAARHAGPLPGVRGRERTRARLGRPRLIPAPRLPGPHFAIANVWSVPPRRTGRRSYGRIVPVAAARSPRSTGGPVGRRDTDPASAALGAYPHVRRRGNHVRSTRSAEPRRVRPPPRVTGMRRFRLFGRSPAPARPAARWPGGPPPLPRMPGCGQPGHPGPPVAWRPGPDAGPATRAARPVVSGGVMASPVDPPTDPHGFPPLAGRPAITSPRTPAPLPAEAAALACAFAVDYLSWDEDDPDRRGRVLLDHLPAAGVHRDRARMVRTGSTARRVRPGRADTARPRWPPRPRRRPRAGHAVPGGGRTSLAGSGRRGAGRHRVPGRGTGPDRPRVAGDAIAVDPRGRPGRARCRAAARRGPGERPGAPLRASWRGPADRAGPTPRRGPGRAEPQERVVTVPVVATGRPG